MTQICLYGSEGSDQGSWGRVSRGMRHGLEHHGALAGYVTVREAALGLDEGDEGIPVEAGYDAPVAIHVGPPHRAGVMHARGQHRERWALIAPNSSWLPDMIHRTLPRVCTGYLSPSAWGAEILRRHTPPGFPVAVWRHGVHPAFDPTVWRPPRTSDLFRVLHFSSTALDRKGTRELVRGWCEFQRRCGAHAELELVLDAPETVRAILDQAQHLYRSSIRVRGRLDLTELEMAMYYVTHDLVVQPSRGEGFGMVPLEALACGVPIVATRNTGHTEWLDPGLPGAVIVPHGPNALIDDGPGALAPSLEVEALAEALTFAYAHRQTLQEEARSHAKTIRQRWSWPAVTDEYLAHRAIDDTPPAPASYPVRYPKEHGR